ncbi:MAG: AraC family transcriptional regulator [Chitinophagaceae bacterium]|nr:AraC family transcriptional regulator [Chitinophagaceae bacterium]
MGKKSFTGIPQYTLEQFRPVHRNKAASSSFGYNRIEKEKMIDGFELYSNEGLLRSIGPLKSEFYRISIHIKGTLDMQIGLEHFKHSPQTIAFTHINQVFAKSNISDDFLCYYLLLKKDFLRDIIAPSDIDDEFPFYNINGTPVFQLEKEELNTIVELVMKMNDELEKQETGMVKAIQMYVYLLLLQAKRSYERQGLKAGTNNGSTHSLTARFQKLVGIHYLSKRKVTDYADMLHVSANHLNRVVKESTGNTALDNIHEMLAQEAKSLLHNTGNTVAEIAYQLGFNDPASFNRFFKSVVKQTPLTYRQQHG